MTLRIECFAIISEGGMLADATGAMPPTLVIEAGSIARQWSLMAGTPMKTSHDLHNGDD